MDCRRVDPLHLHQQTNGKRVGNIVVCAGTHHVNELLIFVFFRKNFSSGGQKFFCMFYNAVDAVKAVHHLIVVLITLNLVEDFNSQFQAKSHTSHICGSFGFIFQNIIAVFRQRALVIKGNDNRSSAGFLCNLSSFYGLRSGTGMRLSNDDRIRAKGLRRRMAELVGSIMVYRYFLCFALQKVFTRMQASVRTTAGNVINVDNTALVFTGLENVSNDGFRTTSH